MLILILVIVGLSLLILTHEAGHFLVAKLLGMQVDEFGFGFPPRIWAKKIGGTEISLNWLPFGGFVRIAGEMGDGEEKEMIHIPQEEPAGEADGRRLFFVRPAWQRAVVIAAGVTVNFLIGWLIIASVLMAGVPKTLVISGIEDGSPAAAAGFQTGDVVNGYTDASSFINVVDAHKGEPMEVSVMRNGGNITLHATPRADVPQNEGALGVYLSEGGSAPEGFFTALGDGFIRSAEILWLTVIAFYQLVHDLLLHGTLLEGVVGPVGIVRVAQGAGVLGFTYLLNLIGLISLNLAVVNLIPFPALDGGRLFLIAVEKIKGSPMPRGIEMILNSAGLALLILLMVLVTFRDVHSIFS